jgi:hypothetical protein
MDGLNHSMNIYQLPIEHNQPVHSLLSSGIGESVSLNQSSSQSTSSWNWFRPQNAGPDSRANNDLHELIRQRREERAETATRRQQLPQNAKHAITSRAVREAGAPRFDFDYQQPVQRTNESLTDPVLFLNETTIVLCLSSRTNFELRATIRETWGRGHPVYFVVGGPPLGENNTVQERVTREQAEHQDLLDTIHPDSYYSLVHKLKYSYGWLIERLPQAQWFVKVDDDSIARISTLDKTLLRNFNPNVPMVFGEIVEHSPVARAGKWTDPLYKPAFYPFWPKGSTGHVVSRPVADYVGRHAKDLINYQGEDSSMGIWLDESNLQVTWIRSPYFQNHGLCHEKEWLVVGHYLTPDQIRACFATADEWSDTEMSEKKRNFFYLQSLLQREQELAKKRLRPYSG